MAGPNFLRVLWATVPNFTVADSCRGGCRPSENPSLKVCKVVEPDYPEAALKSGIRGTVVVEALVGKDGIPEQVRILRGDPTLGSAASAAVCQWRWEPPRHLSGETIPIAIAMNFEP